MSNMKPDRSLHAVVPPAFRCEVRRCGRRTFVCPHGEIDVDTADVVEHAVRHVVGSGVAEVVLDLRGVTFLGSSGLEVAVMCERAATEAGIRFSLKPGAEAVMRVFRVSGLDGLVAT